MEQTRRQRLARKQCVIVALDDHQRVPRTVLDRHVPGGFVAAALATDHEAFPLPERVKGQAAVSPEAFAFRRLDRAWVVLEKLCEELPKGALADEADTGAVRLVEDRKAGAARTLANLLLLQLAN